MGSPSVGHTRHLPLVRSGTLGHGEVWSGHEVFSVSGLIHNSCEALEVVHLIFQSTSGFDDAVQDLWMHANTKARVKA